LGSVNWCTMWCTTTVYLMSLLVDGQNDFFPQVGKVAKRVGLVARKTVSKDRSKRSIIDGALYVFLDALTQQYL